MDVAGYAYRIRVGERVASGASTSRRHRLNTINPRVVSCSRPAHVPVNVGDGYFLTARRQKERGKRNIPARAVLIRLSGRACAARTRSMTEPTVIRVRMRVDQSDALFL